MEWLRLKEYGMKNNHIKKLMLIFQDFDYFMRKILNYLMMN